MIKANKNWVHLKTTYTDDVIDGVPAWMIFKNATGWIGEKKKSTPSNIGYQP